MIHFMPNIIWFLCINTFHIRSVINTNSFCSSKHSIKRFQHKICLMILLPCNLDSNVLPFLTVFYSIRWYNLNKSIATNIGYNIHFHKSSSTNLIRKMSYSSLRNGICLLIWLADDDCIIRAGPLSKTQWIYFFSYLSILKALNNFALIRIA